MALRLAPLILGPVDPCKTEQWRKDMVEVQSTIVAIDDALVDERKIADRQAQAADKSNPSDYAQIEDDD